MQINRLLVTGRQAYSEALNKVNAEHGKLYICWSSSSWQAAQLKVEIYIIYIISTILAVELGEYIGRVSLGHFTIDPDSFSCIVSRQTRFNL